MATSPIAARKTNISARPGAKRVVAPEGVGASAARKSVSSGPAAGFESAAHRPKKPASSTADIVSSLGVAKPIQARPASSEAAGAKTASTENPPALAKAAKANKAAKAPKDQKDQKDAKGQKEKLVRDSFTMPRADFTLIAQLKERALGFKRPTKKSELLRAGLQALAGMDEATLKAALERLPLLKTGRPRNSEGR